MILNNPLGLLGLASIPVILVLHMFRERQNRYVVSSLKLWGFLEAEVHGNKARRIPFSWLLVLDLLAATLLSLAWSQPSIDIPLPVQSGKHVVLMIDTSTSMLARDINPNRLSEAKREVSRILNSLGPQDMATVITFDSKASIIGDSRQDDLNTILSTVSELEAGGSGDSLQEAMILAEAIADSESRPEYHLLSDGTVAIQSDDNTLEGLVWHTFGVESGNQAVLDIDAVRLNSDQYQVFARFANYSEQDASRLVSVAADGAPLQSVRLDMPANTMVANVWGPFNGSPLSVAVTMIGGDNLPEDDSATVGLLSGQSVRVALVAETAYPIQEAIEALPKTELTLFTPQEYLPKFSANLTVFKDFVPDTLPEGTTLIINPEAQDGNSAVNIDIIGDIEIASNALTETPVDDAILKDVDFNGVRWEHITGLASLPPGYRIIAQVRDEQNNVYPILIKDDTGSFPVYLLMSTLADGNFAQHPAFPILIGNAVRDSTGSSLPTSIKIGESIPLPEAGKYRALRITPPKSETITYINTWPRALLSNQTPGAVNIELEDTSGQKSNLVVGVNAGDAIESDLSIVTQAQQTQASAIGDHMVKGETVDLAPWLLGLAIIVLLLEAKLAWR